MKKSKLPKTDSIEKLAEFWDSHDLTDFEDELEQPKRKVFARSSEVHTRAIAVPLPVREAKVIGKLAQKEGVTREELIRRWVRQKIAAQPGAQRVKRSA